MNIIEKQIEVKDYLTKSNLPASDYVINPYVGCPHGCKYCYASFMKRFTGHSEEWGTFIDIKKCSKPISEKRLKGKTVFLASFIMKNLWNRKRIIKEYKPLRESRVWTSGVAKKMLVYVQSRNSTIKGSNYKTVKC